MYCRTEHRHVQKKKKTVMVLWPELEILQDDEHPVDSSYMSAPLMKFLSACSPQILMVCM